MVAQSQLSQLTLQGCHLTRSFGECGTLITAVADVSLDLAPREFALLMGPSGSGKTTLLAMLSGLLHPTAGQVVALGENLWKMSDKQRERFLPLYYRGIRPPARLRKDIAAAFVLTLTRGTDLVPAIPEVLKGGACVSPTLRQADD
jgi:ABC-type branched-subunit amino acid transport system ATPase component